MSKARPSPPTAARLFCRNRAMPAGGVSAAVMAHSTVIAMAASGVATRKLNDSSRYRLTVVSSWCA